MSTFKIHPPSAPIEQRLQSAIVLALTLPFWWPVMCLLLFFVFLVMACVLILMAGVMLILPVVAVIGVEENEEETFKVTAPKDKVPNLKLVVQDQGGQIED